MSKNNEGSLLWQWTALLSFLAVLFLFCLSIFAVFDIKHMGIYRPWGIYILWLDYFWISTLIFLINKKFRYSRLLLYLNQRSEKYWGLFSLELYLIGFIPSFCLFRVMPQGAFFGYLAAVLLFSLLASGPTKDYESALRFLIFIDRVVVAFYSGLILLALAGWGYRQYQHLLQMKNLGIGSYWAIYVGCLLFVWVLALLLLYRVMRNTKFVIRVRMRGQGYLWIFAVEMLLIGMIPSFCIFHLLSPGVFAGYLLVLILFSISMSNRWNRDSHPKQLALTFIDTATVSFYLGFPPLALTLWLFHQLQRLVHFLCAFTGLTGTAFVLMTLLVILDLILNIALGNFLDKCRDLSGGYEASTRANWVYTHTREFVRHANRRETGEWKPPMNAPAKLFWLNVFMIIGTLIAHDTIDFVRPINRLLVYNVFLLFFLALYFVKSRK